MRANEVRRAFTGFFEERDHTRVPSGSLIPHDPTLLFTVAGMVPFKPYLVGEEPAPWPRATSVQKCVRAGGKHNDLDEIGRTKRHLTFFEMMGNFSFGDYFKEQAIPYAWEFVTEVLGLDPDRLWVTVHLSDDEAAAIWRDVVGVPAERIQRLDEDNFWQMADTGPCGPCSEIFWDKGPEYGPDGGPAHGGEDRFVEIWNLVFMQFEQQADGARELLPRPSIDTGLGLERLVAVLQDVDSVFDTDEFARLIARASAETGVPYGEDEASDVSLRILADHARAMTFLISDGVVPSNEDRGYVLRRIMRRAIRHAYRLGVEEVITPALVDEVVAIMADDYPDLRRNHDAIRAVVQREEEGFRRTLATGSAILDVELDRLGADAPIRVPLPSSSTTPTGSPSSSPRRSRPSKVSPSTSTASSRPWPSSGPGPRPPASQGRRRTRRATTRCSTGPTRPSSWVGTRRSPRPRSWGWSTRRTTMPHSRSFSTGPRSTPSPEARSATWARSRPTPAASR